MRSDVDTIFLFVLMGEGIKSIFMISSLTKCIFYFIFVLVFNSFNKLNICQ